MIEVDYACVTSTVWPLSFLFCQKSVSSKQELLISNMFLTKYAPSLGNKVFRPLIIIIQADVEQASFDVNFANKVHIVHRKRSSFEKKVAVVNIFPKTKIFQSP